MSSEDRVRELHALFCRRERAMVDTLEALVTRESPSDVPEAVSALAEWIAGRIALSGLSVETVPCEGRGDAVLARLGGDGPGTLVLGHLDTVWPLGTLQEWPFEVEGDVARGPGVFDMKAGIAVAMAVLEAAFRGEVSPKGSVTLLLVPDEEVGSGASKLLTVSEAIARGRCLVLEPSGDGGAAKVARKGIGTIRVRFSGVAAHAGLEPEKGASALKELSRFVLYAEALGDAALGTTVVATVATAGQRTNVVPEEAELAVDFRAWTAAEGERVAAALHGYRPTDERVAVEVTGGMDRAPMEGSDASLVLYQTAAAAARALGGEMPAARVGGASDGNFTAAAGVPTLDGLGPAGGGAHGRGEHVALRELSRRAAILAALLEGMEA